LHAPYIHDEGHASSTRQRRARKQHSAAKGTQAALGSPVNPQSKGNARQQDTDLASIDRARATPASKTQRKEEEEEEEEEEERSLINRPCQH